MKYLWLIVAATLLLSACDRRVEKVVIPIRKKSTESAHQQSPIDLRTTQSDDEDSIISDIVPEIRVKSIDPIAKGEIVDGKLVYSSPTLAGTVTGDFEKYPRLLVEFDLDASDAIIMTKRCTCDASIIIDNPASDPTFRLDPINPSDLDSENPFQDTNGRKSIGYRVKPIDTNGNVLVDAQDLILASRWKTIGFTLNDPTADAIRVVDAGLRIDTGERNDGITKDPRVGFRVHGEFLASTIYRLELNYPFNKKTQTDHLEVAGIGEVVYDPVIFNPELANTTTKIDLTYRLMSSTNGGGNWSEVSSDLMSFQHQAIQKAKIGAVAEELGGRPYRGGERLIVGTLADSIRDSSILYLVQMEIGQADEDGEITFHARGHADIRFDQKDQQYKFHSVVMAAESVEKVRVRVEQLIQGKRYYSPWAVTSVQEPQPFDLASLKLAKKTDTRGNRRREPGPIPEIVGRLTGSPTVEALEDNSKVKNPFEYREMNYVRVEFFNSKTPPDENSSTDAYARTNAFGHFRYRPKSLKPGANKIWARAVLKLENGHKYFSEPQAVSLEVESVEFPTLSMKLRDTDAKEQDDADTEKSYWSTLDPRVVASLATTRTSLRTHQVTIEFAVDLPEVAGDEAEVAGRAFAGLENNATYFPLLAGHEEEIVKVRARLAYRHPQLGGKVYSDWTELSLQLQAATHDPSKVSSLEVLDCNEKNELGQAIVRGDSARLAGNVSHGEGISGPLYVQFQDASNGKVLGKVTTSRSGRFEHKLKKLPQGTLNIEAVVLDWNYQTSAVEPGPPTPLILDIQAVIPIAVASLELHSDTGESATDGITVNPTLIGQLHGTGRLDRLKVALDHGNGQEAIVTSDSRGRFFYRPDDLKTGQKYTFRARVATWNVSEAGYTYSAAQQITLELETSKNIRPQIGKVELADASDDNWNQTTGLVHDLTLQGRVNTAKRMDGIVVEVDFDGDGKVDDLVRSDRRGEFVLRPGRLDAGQQSPRVRAVEIGYNAGPWLTAGTFDYQPEK